MWSSHDSCRNAAAVLAAILLAVPLQAQITRPRVPALPGAPPTGVVATPQGPTSVALSWMAPAEASGFWILRAAAPDTTYYQGNTLINGTSFVDRGLLPGRAFSYKVKAVYTDPNAPRNPGISPAVNVTLPAAPHPTGLAATLITGDQLKLTWNALPEASGYRLYRNGSLFTEIKPLPSGVTGQLTLATSYTGPVAPGTYVHQLQSVYRLEGFSTEVTSDLTTAPSVTTTVVAPPPPPPPPIRGFADTHTHQFANRGFGGLMFWGNAYGPIEEALPWCTPAHGPGGLNDIIGNAERGTLGHLVGGSPQFDGWPKWNTLTHQQMHSDWLYRALQGGLKLMVMHAVNNEMLCGLAKKADGRTCDDMEAVDLQLQAAKDMEEYTDNQFGGTGKGWYRLVYSPKQAREAIAKGQLAVVLGIEVDNIFGCRSDACDESTVDKELQRYYEMGVRHFHPIHFANNAFGGFALFSDLFNGNNKILTGRFAEVGDVQDCEANGFEFRFGFVSDLLRAVPALAMYDRPVYPSSGAHCNSQGLTPLGQYLITQMMNRGMIIDIDHMSKQALDATLGLTSARDYPVIAGHTGFVGTSIGEKKSEGQKTESQVRAIADKGGLVSVILHQGNNAEISQYSTKWATVANDCGLSSKSWAQSYLYAVDKMGGPGVAAVGLATDQVMNQMVAPRFGPEACGFNPNIVLGPLNLRPPSQMNPVVYPVTPLLPGSALGQSVSGRRTFDYNVDGLAHVGMLPDFIQDLRNVGLTPTDLDPLFRSAEAYITMWERAVQKVPQP